MRGSPGETISYKCNACKLVSLNVNPGELIWLMEKLWKLTSSIEKPDQPISSISNPSKSLSLIEKQWKSFSSVRNPIAQFSLEKRSSKHFVDMFSLIKSLLTKFVWKLYEHPQKTSVNWLEAHTLHFYSIGSPSKTNLFMENQGKLFQGQKTQKMQSLKRKHSKFFFIEKKTVWIDFIQKDSCKKINEKNNEVKLNYWGTQENKLSAMVTPWGKKCYLEIHWNQFHYWKSQKLFSFKRNPPKRTSFTEKPRKLISPKEKSKKSTLTTRIQKKLFSRLENRKKKSFHFFARSWEQNMLMGKSCNKFVLKIFLEISFMMKNSMEIVLIQKISWKPI